MLTQREVEELLLAMQTAAVGTCIESWKIVTRSRGTDAKDPAGARDRPIETR
jgi:hypothetical protein